MTATKKKVLSEYEELMSLVNMLSTRMEATAEDLTPGNVAHHRAWFLMHGRQLGEIFSRYVKEGSADHVVNAICQMEETP